MFEYGMTKLIPTQFPSVAQHSGHTRGKPVLQGMLWTSVGAATGYEIFTGCAELLAGVLLIVPRTALLGAIICLADMTQVFLLNMSYDIGVKMISFHLILVTCFFLAPDARRLADLFLWIVRSSLSPIDRPPAASGFGRTDSAGPLLLPCRPM